MSTVGASVVRLTTRVFKTQIWEFGKWPLSGRVI